MYSYQLTTGDKLVKYTPYLLFIILAIICINNCFFFDTIQLSSLHASWYYDNNFRYFLLPNNIDSGHPPLNGMMLAAVWKLLGKSLWVGHVWILLWSLIMIYQLQKICENLFSKDVSFYVSLAILVDATFLTQSILVSPDIILMASFFTAIRGILENKKYMIVLGILFLSLISMRGMMCTAALFFFYLYLQYGGKQKSFSLKNLIVISLPFWPGVFLAFAFLGYHYYAVGWIGYHPDMPWAECFQKIESVYEFFRNVIVMGWRFLDFGRIVIWLLLVYVIFQMQRKKNRGTSSLTFNEASIVILFILLIITSSYSFLFHKLLSGPRYLFPHYALIALIVFILLNKVLNAQRVKIFALITSLILLSGNLLKYPDRISTGWDVTLSHLPFYQLRENMLDYLSSESIPLDKVSSGFCISGDQHNIDLSSPIGTIIHDYTSYEETDYFIYSNISNLEDYVIDDITDESKYTLIKKFKKGNVFMSLYKKKREL